MLKIVCGFVAGAMFGGSMVSGAATEDELRLALEDAFAGSDDLDRVEDYLDFVSKYDKWNGIDVDNTDELMERFLNWKATDDTINANDKERKWEFGHTRFSDWSRNEKLTMVMDEKFISKDSRSAIDSTNCLQVELTDSSKMWESKINEKVSYNVDNRGYDVAGIQDQGQCASCWDFSDVATVELNRNMDMGLRTDSEDSESSFVKLSEQFVLDCIDDGIGSCEGGYPIFTLMWMQESGGICASSDYNDYTEEESTCARSTCTASEASLYSSLYCLSDETDEQLSYAASTFSVEFAFKVYSEFYNYESGIYSCDTSDEFIGWHAVTLVGVTDDYYIVKNSWSTDWGDSGYFLMSRDSFDDCAMSHFAFVSFNDISDSITETDNAPKMDIATVASLRSQSQKSGEILGKEASVSGIISKHIKVNGQTNEIVLYSLGIIAGLSILLIICAVFYRAVRRCRQKKQIQAEANFSEQSALLDGYVAL